MPEPMTPRLNAGANQALHAAQIRRQLTDQGIDPAARALEQLAAFMRSEIPIWTRIVKDSGAHAEGFARLSARLAGLSASPRTGLCAW
jgi:tripartite-type tricarboxylate transporter receptor subunit TctC